MGTLLGFFCRGTRGHTPNQIFLGEVCHPQPLLQQSQSLLLTMSLYCAPRRYRARELRNRGEKRVPIKLTFLTTLLFASFAARLAGELRLPNWGSR